MVTNVILKPSQFSAVDIHSATDHIDTLRGYPVRGDKSLKIPPNCLVVILNEIGHINEALCRRARAHICVCEGKYIHNQNYLVSVFFCDRSWDYQELTSAPFPVFVIDMWMTPLPRAMQD